MTASEWIGLGSLLCAVAAIVTAGVSMHYCNRSARAINALMELRGQPDRVQIVTWRSIAGDVWRGVSYITLLPRRH